MPFPSRCCLAGQFLEPFKWQWRWHLALASSKNVSLRVSTQWEDFSACIDGTAPSTPFSASTRGVISLVHSSWLVIFLETQMEMTILLRTQLCHAQNMTPAPFGWPRKLLPSLESRRTAELHLSMRRSGEKVSYFTFPLQKFRMKTREPRRAINSLLKNYVTGTI